MKAPLWVCASLLCGSLAVTALGQSRGGGSRGNGNSGSAGVGPTFGPNVSQPGGLSSASTSPFISGKVVLDDGSVLSEPAAIETICSGVRRTVAYTDNHGAFSFRFGDPASAANGDITDASSSMMVRPSTQQQSTSWKTCELEAALAGFTSEVIELANRADALEDSDVGRIKLHRMAQVEGSSISVTSALAPPDAKKALEKARDAEKKQQWEQAQRLLEKAVNIYPKYATAWYELGHVQMQRNDPVGAKRSFEQSVAADPKFVNPYDGLARLAFRLKKWPEVTDTTNKLLALDPVSFPAAYFLNGVANYYLQNWDVAEKIVRQGIRVDDAHRLPKLQYLLGMVMIQKHDYEEASDFLKQYLQLTKQPAEIAEAQRELATIEKLSGSSAAEQKR